MRLTLLQKGFLGFGGIISLGMLLLTLSMTSFFMNYGLAVHENSLKHHATYIMQTPQLSDQALNQYAKSHGIRITVIDPKGTVRFDSEASLSTMENHLSRPEIRNAIETGVGVRIHQSETLKKPMMYVAIKASDGHFIRTAMDIASVHEEQNHVQHLIALATVLILLAILFLLYVSLKKLLAPIRNVNENLKKLAQGEQIISVPIQSKDELGDLSVTTNQLIEQIAAQQERLKSLENLRRDFVANVSHELRTPLSAIVGFLQTLEDGAIDDATHNRRFLTIIARNVERLTHLVDDILNLARIENNTAPTQRLNVTQELSQLLEDMALIDNPRIKLSLPPKSIFININQSELLSAFRNYIDNAIKYAPEGDIQIALSETGDSVQYAVTDQGQGIAQPFQERLFERFYRPDKDRSREFGGTGLGLAIVKHILQKQGGQVLVTSTVGVGSTFSWILPKHHGDVTELS